MNMDADPLACLRSTKYPDDWHLGSKVLFRHAVSKGQWRVQLRRGRLVMVDTVEAHAKGLHRAGVALLKA